MGHDNSKRSRRSFSDEFKRDAVALVRETGRPISHVAEELGLYDSTLGNWVRAAEAAERRQHPRHVWPRAQHRARRPDGAARWV